MNVSVARLYRFGAYHLVPSLPEPWCSTHYHDYTVEVVAQSSTKDLVDTDWLDAAWRTIGPDGLPGQARNLNDHFADTTVEALAENWLIEFQAAVPEVVQVTVWEDDTRWGRASA